MVKTGKVGGSSSRINSESSHAEIVLEDRILAHIILVHDTVRPAAIPIRDIWSSVRSMEDLLPLRRGEVVDALGNIATSSLISLDRESALVYPAWDKIDSEVRGS